MPSGSRLVASNAIFGQLRSSASASLAHTSMTCSQLSSSTSRARRPIASASAAITGRSGSTLTPSTLATVTATRSWSCSGARSANQTPSPEPSSSPAATWSPRRVLPAPPEPVSVTRRELVIRRRTSASSASRPMKLDTCTGRLFSSLGLSSDASGGKAVGRPSASSWKICSGRPRSFSRCRPRSAMRAPAGGGSGSRAAVAAESTTWPPCATAAIRAARCTSRPTKPTAVRDASPEWMPMRTRTSPPGAQGCDCSARCISIAAATQALGDVNTAKNASPWVSTS